MSELLAMAAVTLTLLTLAGAALRRYLPANLIEYLEQLGKRDGRDLYDD